MKCTKEASLTGITLLIKFFNIYNTREPKPFKQTDKSQKTLFINKITSNTFLFILSLEEKSIGLITQKRKLEFYECSLTSQNKKH